MRGTQDVLVELLDNRPVGVIAVMGVDHPSIHRPLAGPQQLKKLLPLEVFGIVSDAGQEDQKIARTSRASVLMPYDGQRPWSRQEPA